MGKDIILKLRRNKANGQINASFSKKDLDIDTRNILNKAKKAFVNLRRFEI
jgi:hypothetical protein